MILQPKAYQNVCDAQTRNSFLVQNHSYSKNPTKSG